MAKLKQMPSNGGSQSSYSLYDDNGKLFCSVIPHNDTAILKTKTASFEFNSFIEKVSHFIIHNKKS